MRQLIVLLGACFVLAAGAALAAVRIITPALALTAVQSAARDMGLAGFDNDTGLGLIQADGALMSPSIVTEITPNAVDLVNLPPTFTIAGETFQNRGFGLPVVNFTRSGLLLGQARANSLVGSTTLAVPFPTDATSLNGPLPGLSAGAVLIQVYNQTGPTSYLLVGSTPLTVQDSRPPAQVTSIIPDSLDLANSPTTFTITGQRFADSGFGLPVVNFTRAGLLLGQARANSLTGNTTLTVPFPTDASSLNGHLLGLSAGTVLVQVYNQTGPSSYLLISSMTLTVNDMRPCALCVRSLTPSSIDLIASPATFIVAGDGFVDRGFGPPVVNFTRAGVLLGQARANSLIGRTTLIVPLPTDATSLKGLRAGLQPDWTYQLPPRRQHPAHGSGFTTTGSGDEHHPRIVRSGESHPRHVYDRRPALHRHWLRRPGDEPHPRWCAAGTSPGKLSHWQHHADRAVPNQCHQPQRPVARSLGRGRRPRAGLQSDRTHQLFAHRQYHAHRDGFAGTSSDGHRTQFNRSDHSSGNLRD
jgi:hypothetical protein